MTHSSHQHIVKQTAVFFLHVDRHLCGLFRSEVAQVNVGLQLGFNKKNHFEVYGNKCVNSKFTEETDMYKQAREY